MLGPYLGFFLQKCILGDFFPLEGTAAAMVRTFKDHDGMEWNRTEQNRTGQDRT